DPRLDGSNLCDQAVDQITTETVAHHTDSMGVDHSEIEHHIQCTCVLLCCRFREVPSLHEQIREKHSISVFHEQLRRHNCGRLIHAPRSIVPTGLIIRINNA